MTKPYDKKWLSMDDQMVLLESRGLVIDDKQDCKELLYHLGYYRLSGYALAFEPSRHKFLEGTSYRDIADAYCFDMLLRDVIADALEVIEVDFRTTVAHFFSQRVGAFGHLDQVNFQQPRGYSTRLKLFDHADWLESLREEAARSKELFVSKYQQTYDEFPDLPIWIATEVASFGTVSRMFSGMVPNLQKPIALRYSMQQQDLASTLHHFTYIRNICAHHSRLWDRELRIGLQLPTGKHWQPPLIPEARRLYPTLLLIYRILQKCRRQKGFTAEWKKRIDEVMLGIPNVPGALDRMGMPEKWNRHPYWV